MAVLRGSIRLTAAALCLAVIILGLVKATDVQGFGQTVNAHGLLTGQLASVGALGAIAIELGIGVLALFMLMVHRSRVALGLLGLLFLVFAAYSFALVLQPPAEAVSCGCGFSQAPIENWQPIAARNAAIAATCFAAIAAFGRSSVKRSDEFAVSPAAP